MRWLLLLIASSCAPRVVEVRTEVIDLIGVRAVMRLDAATLCEAEPRFLLDDVSSVNALLRAFIRAWPGTPAPEWTDQELELLAEATQTLPRVVQAHGETLAHLERCPFARTGAWPELTARAQGSITEVRARLEQIPEGLQAAKHARAVTSWRRDRLSNAEAARRACTPRTRATIYAAWRDGERTTWRFCDGVEAHAERGNAPRLEGITARSLPERVYRAALARFPVDAMQTAPGEEEISAW